MFAVTVNMYVLDYQFLCKTQNENALFYNVKLSVVDNKDIVLILSECMCKESVSLAS